MAAAIGKPRITDYIERFTEVFRPERGQASEAGPGWYTLLLVLYGVYYIFNIYSVTRYLVYLHRCKTCMPDNAGIGWNLSLAIFNTLCFYHVLKQRSLGWAMLLIQTIVLACVKVSWLFHYYEHRVFLSSFLPWYVLPFLLYVAFGFFLLRPSVIAFFGITGPIKDKALLIGVSVGILAMALTTTTQ